MSLLRDTTSLLLPNGVRIYCLPRRTSSVEIQVHVATGSIHEGRFLGCGLSHFLEHMAFQGCKGYPGNSIADTVNGLGGDVNAYTSCNRTCYRMLLPSKHYRSGLKMLSSMVRWPDLPAKRFEAEKDVILRECDRGSDDPDCRLYENFMKQMFLIHPLRHPVIGYREMISQVTRDMTMEYHQSRYTPERCVVVAAGGVDSGEFFAAASDYFSSWEKACLSEMSLPLEPFPAAPREGEIYFDDPLHRIMCGIRAPRFGASDLPAVELLFGVLGTGDGSILNRKLILESGLGVAVRSGCYSWGEHSFAVISGKAVPEKMPDFSAVLKQTLEKVAAGEFSAEDVEREKEQQYADRLRELRDNVTLAGEIAGGVLYAGTPLAGDVYLDNLLKTDFAALQNAAEKYLNPDLWVTVVQNNGCHSKTHSADAISKTLSVRRSTNGVQMLCAPDHELPLCNFFMVLPGGALCEQSGQSGLTKLVAANLTAGSQGLSEQEIYRRMDAAGIDFDISGGLNSITLEFSAPRHRIEQAVDLFAQILQKPLFPEDVWQREKTRLVSILKERLNKPEKLAFDTASAGLYGTHPYAMSGYGSPDIMQSLTPEQGRGYFQNCCHAPQTVIGFGGDCSPDEAFLWSEKIIAAINWSIEPPQRHSLPEFADEKTSLLRKLSRDQTVVVRVLPGWAAVSEELVDVAEIFGQVENGLSSNLFKLVREKNALSYAVGMSYAMGFHPGYFAFYAMTAPDSGKKVLKLLNSEISRIATGGLSDEELDAAKASAAFEAEKIFDTPETWLRTAAMDAFYGIDPLQLPQRSLRIRNISNSRCNELLKKCFAVAGGVEVIVEGAGDNN